MLSAALCAASNLSLGQKARMAILASIYKNYR
jgi:hypothetical protein